jgi:NAD(P)H-dependent flavin oxidoreductase YrpB (nitropropane dioxygenase family)
MVGDGEEPAQVSETGAEETRMTNGLTGLLGIRLPIIQAPIGGASSAQLVAAVSNAGGLGVLAATWRSPSDLSTELRKIRELTDRPFGVNFVLEWDPQQGLSVCAGYGVPVVSFFWGDPSPHLRGLHERGVIVMHTVGCAREAAEFAAGGVDVIVAQGWEAGGHVWGRVGSLALVPAVVDAVSPVPVVAAGGIGDGRGLAAALSLGASGIWLGSRFVATVESAAHPEYKQRILDAAEDDTDCTTLFDEGWRDAPHRVLKNSTLRRWSDAGRPPRGSRPGEGEAIAHLGDGTPILRYGDSEPTEGMVGDLDAMAMYAGQSSGLVRQILTVESVMQSLIDEARTAVESTSRLLAVPPPQ